MITRAWLVGVAVLLVGALGCDKDDSFVTGADVKAEINGAVDTATPRCTPGLVHDCPCPMGALGVQTCADDGKRWGACADCWNALPPSGSSSSSGGGAPMMQKVMCDANQSAAATYPGMKASELFGVRVLFHDPQTTPDLHQTSAAVGDGEVRAQCLVDYDIFVGP